MYRKLKSLYRSLIELETELSMFNEDKYNLIDAETSYYVDQLKARIQGYETDIKNLLKEE